MLKRSLRSFDRSIFGIDFDSALDRGEDNNDDDDDGLSENVTVFISERFSTESVDFGTELSDMIDFVFTFSFESFRS